MTWCCQETLRWRHNERGSVSNHQPHDCLLNGLFGRRSKKTWKLRVIGLCAGNSPGTDEFPAQMASNAENVAIWWRHHDSHYLDQRWSVLKMAIKINGSYFWPWATVPYGFMWPQLVNTLRPWQNGRNFTDDNFKRIFLNENIWIWNTIWLDFVPMVPIGNKIAFGQIMAWCRTSAKPLSEPMMV